MARTSPSHPRAVLHGHAAARRRGGPDPRASRAVAPAADAPGPGKPRLLQQVPEAPGTRHDSRTTERTPVGGRDGQLPERTQREAQRAPGTEQRFILFHATRHPTLATEPRADPRRRRTPCAARPEMPQPEATPATGNSTPHRTRRTVGRAELSTVCTESHIVRWPANPPSPNIHIRCAFHSPATTSTLLRRPGT